MTVTTYNLIPGKDGCRKPKLPRKRKKASIKIQGRKWYHDTIKLYQITNGSQRFFEPVCKFWVNSEVKMQPNYIKGGNINMILTPTKYW